jgi:hypothetical protein
MAATYSRGIYKTTTIGNAAFDGRVRNGNGSDHSFMATKKFIKEQFRTLPCGTEVIRPFSENYTQETLGFTIRELKS